MALDRVLCPFVLVPVVGAGASALDQQFPDGPVLHVIALVIDDASLVAGHQLAGRPGTDATRSVRDKDVKNLGAADAVEDLHAESILEAVVQGLWQCLPRRHGLANAR